jgi:hypothetical protein
MSQADDREVSPVERTLHHLSGGLRRFHHEPPVTLSVVVPLFNEEENVRELHRRLCLTLHTSA